MNSLANTLAVGDEAVFAELADRHRRELQVHCYRMLGSVDESEDAVQETLLRAWRSRSSFHGRSSIRTWLYRIATNACIDALSRRSRRPAEAPDEELEEAPARGLEPDAELVAKETYELALMTAIQHLPPQQRAVLIVRTLLGWSARDAASLLDTSVASVNSSLQRARAGMKEHLPEQRLEWARVPEPSEEERTLLRRYLDAVERADAGALVEVAAAE